jgi:hypothetical protein
LTWGSRTSSDGRELRPEPVAPSAGLLLKPPHGRAGCRFTRGSTRPRTGGRTQTVPCVYATRSSGRWDTVSRIQRPTVGRTSSRNMRATVARIQRPTVGRTSSRNMRATVGRTSPTAAPRWRGKRLNCRRTVRRLAEVEHGQVIDGSDVVDVPIAAPVVVTLRRAARALEAPARPTRDPRSTARQCFEGEPSALLGARPCALAAVHPASRPDDHRETDTAHYDRGVARGSLFRPTPRTAPGALSLRHAPHPRRVPHVTRARPH